MDYMKPLNDEAFLQELQSSYSIRYINNSKHDVYSLIPQLTFFEAPDYISNCHYVERFVVDAYERVSIKPKKFTSLYRADEKAMRKRANTTQDLFYTTQYSTPNNPSNIRHLRKNIIDMINQKTRKIESYNANYPQAVFRHALIELDCHCRVFVDKYGQFFSSVVPADNLSLVDYEIYRDQTFIANLQSSFRESWDLLLFVNRFANYGDTIYYVYCVDLKQDIDCENMINYPELIFQVIQKKSICLNTAAGKKIKNIRYSCDADVEKRKLLSEPPHHIEIGGVRFTKDKIHDTIYATNNHSLFFELSQFAFAFGENLDIATILQHEQFLQETLSLVFKNQQITLTKQGIADRYSLNIFV